MKLQTMLVVAVAIGAVFTGAVFAEPQHNPTEKLTPAETGSGGKENRAPADSARQWFARMDGNLAKTNELVQRFEFQFPEYSEYDPEDGKRLLRDLDALEGRIEGTRPPPGPKELRVFAAGFQELLSDRVGKVRYMIEHYMSGDWKPAQKTREAFKKERKFEDGVSRYHKMKELYGRE
ncbi:hypothetical protein C8P63_1263 [Melghirimyces profundicolus]|uniref:Uncharacterized protein n=1 Tax=Melghirimyces profundicolus TaxID=1242148 RepID=A0A2T6BCC7_9BACL|nr:hypothetical protein [Melghirimyces profundicolus]PTX53717.1 hypothetical protein C8P63_1263 [Melghirimyces profundicolus]